MKINNFYIAGINYKKTDASVRGCFAISNTQYRSLLQKASSQHISEVFILSTCNRTEIYGIAESAEELIQLICSETTGSIETFKQLAYIKKGNEAVNHLFEVAAGLDSQILGDYEIIGQIKQSIKISKEFGFINAFFERLLNTVLQCSKSIRNQTQLSSGTVSVSFAAIQFLRNTVVNVQDKKILLLGTGKIGRNTCKNIVDYLGTTNITLINRTPEKALDLAHELNIKAASFLSLKDEIKTADIIIVATNAEKPVIKKQDLVNGTQKVLIDLSIPNNIEPAAKELSNVILIDVDGLSKINDATLQNRLAEVPKARIIIATHIQEFMEWNAMRRNVPVIKAVKQKLSGMYQCELYIGTQSSEVDYSFSNQEATIQKVITTMAVKMRNEHKPGCNYIEAINDFITLGVN